MRARHAAKQVEFRKGKGEGANEGFKDNDNFVRVRGGGRRFVCRALQNNYQSKHRVINKFQDIKTL